MTTKKKKSRHTQNAPWWWKRTESALIYLLTGLIPLIGLSRTISQDMTHDITLIVLPGAILAVKSIGIFFMGVEEGNDDNLIVNNQAEIFSHPDHDFNNTGKNNIA